jgi:RsiW-degrading membrane proteinase PrsW (M82 family)
MSHPFIAEKFLMEFLLGLLPVCAFLAALYFLDSYKLVPYGTLFTSLGAGCLAAVLAYPVNVLLMQVLWLPFDAFSRYVAPLTEETLKATFLISLLINRRTGFLVDSAIHGFAIGTGFALVENAAYILALGSATPLLWLVRGFGTAMMHGATTSIAAIIGKSLSDRSASPGMFTLLPGIGVAIILHSTFNHFFLPAVASTLFLVLAFPVMMSAVFIRSERATQRWLGVGFDSDRELLEMLTSGRLGETRIGQYFGSLQKRFRGEVLADMLCLLRLHLELAIAAKGLLLMRESGFEVPGDPEWRERFTEIEFLEKSVGATGLLALVPFIHTGKAQLKEILRV